MPINGIDLYGDAPMFPTFYHRPLTEERIEREVERLTDRADKQFLSGKMTQEQYDRWNKALDRWANEGRNGA